MNDESKAYKLHMGPAPCAVDLGDGSERGEYVCQITYWINWAGPHRSINLMYCYYPLMKVGRRERANWKTNKNVTFQWDYAYDDYFPYTGGIGGSTDGEPFISMKDVRKHGQMSHSP